MCQSVEWAEDIKKKAAQNNDSDIGEDYGHKGYRDPANAAKTNSPKPSPHNTPFKLG